MTIVAWNMADKHAFATLIRAPRGDAVVPLATFLLTLFRDLTTGILAGFCLASLVFMRRMSQSFEVEALGYMDGDDVEAAGTAAPGDRARRLIPLGVFHVKRS